MRPSELISQPGVALLLWVEESRCLGFWVVLVSGVEKDAVVGEERSLAPAFINLL